MKRMALLCLHPSNVTYAAIGYQEAEVDAVNAQMIHIAGQVKDRPLDKGAVAAYDMLRKKELEEAALNTKVKYFVSSATDCGSILPAKAAGPISKQITAQLGKRFLNFSPQKTDFVCPG